MISPSGVYPRLLIRLPLVAYRMGLGDLMRLMHILVVTTQGRASGSPRFTPLEYRRHGRRMYIISAKGTDADWVQNIMASPAVTVQRGSETFSACAELVQHGGERLMALRLFHNTAPYLYDSIYAPMQVLRGRRAVAETALPQIKDDYTLVRVTPQPNVSALPPVDDDLRWIPPTVTAVTIGLAALSVILIVWRAVINSRRAGEDYVSA